MEAFVSRFLHDPTVRQDCMIEWKAQSVAQDIEEGEVTVSTRGFIQSLESHPRVMDRTIDWDLPRSNWLAKE